MNGLLDDYAASFYGYGCWQAPVWFVGPEEGGGGNRAEIKLGNYASAQSELCCRLEHWDAQRQAQAQGAPPLLNLQEVPVAQWWFGANVAQRQNTWARLIMVLSGIQQIPQADVLEYRRGQRNAWGTPDCAACDLSLFPLPSPSRSLWAYKHFLFVTRPIYEDAYLEQRASFLRQQIELRANAHPLTVVFYGSHPDWWQQIAGVAGNPIDVEPRVCVYPQDLLPPARLFSVPHPAHGPNDQCFRHFGQLINGLQLGPNPNPAHV